MNQLPLVLRRLCVSTRTMSSRVHPSLARGQSAVTVQRQVATMPPAVGVRRFSSDLHIFRNLPEQEKPDLPMPPCVENLDADLEKTLIGNIVMMKFRMQNLKKELAFLHANQFPLPESLTEKQWTTLFELQDRDSRTFYIDSIIVGKEDDTITAIRERDDRVAKGINFEDFEHIKHGLPPDQFQATLNLIKQIYQDRQQYGEPVPHTLNKEQMKELLYCQGVANIEKTFRYLVLCNQKKMKEFINRRARNFRGEKTRQRVIEERKRETHLVYGLGHNSILPKIYKQGMNRILNNRVAMEFCSWGQPLVIDMQFLSLMNFKNAKSLICKEVQHGMSRNRESRFPFALYFCNFSSTCDKCNYLLKSIPTIMNDDYPVIVTEKDYVDCFPRERLVYLTPDSSNELITYDTNDIFVVGAVMDAGEYLPRTLAQAKKDGVRHARLPTNRYVGLSANLNVDHVMAIMADFRATGDWFFSFRWVPARFFRNKILSYGSSAEREATYIAHSKLSPQNHPDLQYLRPAEYRRQYRKAMQEAFQSATSSEIKRAERPSRPSYNAEDGA